MTLGIDRHWRPLNIPGRPTKMPSVPPGRQIIFRADYRGLKIECICNSLEDMQKFYDMHAGKAKISWHHTGVFVMPLSLAA